MNEVATFDPQAAPVGEARAEVWFLHDRAKVWTRGGETGGRFSLVELEGPEGDEPPLHVHHDDEEGFYVLEGELALFLPGQELRCVPGQYALLPRGVPHTYRVERGPARWLVLSSPAMIERFIEGYGEPAAGPGLPTPAGPPDVERLGRLAAEHGVELLGPPGSRP